MKYMDYYSFTDLEGWKAALGDPQQTDYPKNGNLSTTDWALGRESPPVRDRHPNLGTTQSQHCQF